ncbi:hypothetical protein FNYG_06869 [Fusarium nygamai]|uniref:Uncharacterized protein n=1 Tax=Gibberella nygamai TaxID=42673 RepID=A0A2K0WBY0_GIBNY|nr:hypothetical protein FNYG_06869 [Fusarium nygamai]
MTSEKRLLEINGLIIIGGDHGLQIGALIQASLTPVVFDVWIFVSFTDQIKFDLRAVATDVTNLKDLSQANVNFTLTLESQILELFYNDILDFLAELQNLATASKGALEFGLQKRMNEIFDESNTKKQKIAALEARIAEEKRYSRAIEPKPCKRSWRQRLNWRSYGAQNMLLSWPKKTLRCLEWHTLYESAKKEKERLSKERDELLGKKKSTFGNVALELQKCIEWFDVAKAKLDGLLADSEERKKNLPNLGIFARAKEKLYIETIDAAASFLKNRLQEGEGVLKDMRDGYNRPEFRDIEIQINENDTRLKEATDMLDKLIRQDVVGFIAEAMVDKDKVVDAKKSDLDAMEDGNSQWMQAIREAQAKLDAGRSDLDRVIAKEEEKINQARDSMQLRQLQQELRSVEEEERRQREQHDDITTGLRMIRNEINRGSDSVRQLVQRIRPVNFKIKGMTITADGKEIVQGRAMMFKISVEHEGKKLCWRRDGRLFRNQLSYIGIS